MSLKIKAISVGTLVDTQQAATTYLHGWGQKHDVVSLVFVIEGAGPPIVVDTGASSPEVTMANHGYTLRRLPHEEPAQAFADAGVDRAAVELVIYTHLHWDHVYNSELFPNARFVVQHDELTYAVDPIEPHRVGYEKLPGVLPPWIQIWDRIDTVDGDVPSFLPGISLITLPGHTPGGQGVAVECANGRYVLTGDCIDTYANWEGSRTMSHIPSAVHMGLKEYWESFAKLDRLAAEGWQMIPSHDHLVLERGVFD
jgi:N-acyl homoserine lactone hydrolase